MTNLSSVKNRVNKFLAAAFYFFAMDVAFPPIAGRCEPPGTHPERLPAIGQPRRAARKTLGWRADEIVLETHEKTALLLWQAREPHDEFPARDCRNACTDQAIFCTTISRCDAAAAGKSFGFKYSAVKLSDTSQICSGVPCAMTLPPPSPPSGPMSMSQSAHLMTSRLCSMIRMVLPRSARRFKTFSRLWMSAKCSPVVGSSRTYSVWPVGFLPSSVASFTRCASPPDSCVLGWPSLTYER